jgi:hypothetical protein
MPIANYTNGFPDGVSIRNVPIIQTHPGKVFWLSNNTTGLLPGQKGGSDGNKGTFNAPFLTLAGALAQCASGRGDIILVKPGHAETITSATALLFNVAGVAIIGLGIGDSRPTFTFTTANTAKIPVSAANVSVQNCIFVGNFLSIATCFLLTTAPEFTVDRCSFRDTSAILGFLSIVTTTVSVNADGLTFTNNEVQSDATTTPGPAIVIAGTMARLTVSDNFITHSVASNNISALIEHGALVVTKLRCERNLIYSINTDTATGAILVKTTATTGSGIIAGNRVRALDPDSAIMVTAAAVQYGHFDNLYTGETNTSGLLLPVVYNNA